jgi:hypothetical protein
MEGGLEKGAAVREKAKEMTVFLSSKETVYSERARVRRASVPHGRVPSSTSEVSYEEDRIKYSNRSPPQPNTPPDNRGRPLERSKEVSVLAGARLNGKKSFAGAEPDSPPKSHHRSPSPDPGHHHPHCSSGLPVAQSSAEQAFDPFGAPNPAPAPLLGAVHGGYGTATNGWFGGGQQLSYQPYPAQEQHVWHPLGADGGGQGQGSIGYTQQQQQMYWPQEYQGGAYYVPQQQQQQQHEQTPQAAQYAYSQQPYGVPPNADQTPQGDFGGAPVPQILVTHSMHPHPQQYYYSQPHPQQQQSVQPQQVVQQQQQQHHAAYYDVQQYGAHSQQIQQGDQHQNLYSKSPEAQQYVQPQEVPPPQLVAGSPGHSSPAQHNPAVFAPGAAHAESKVEAAGSSGEEGPEIEIKSAKPGRGQWIPTVSTQGGIGAELFAARSGLRKVGLSREIAAGGSVFEGEGTRPPKQEGVRQRRLGGEENAGEQLNSHEIVSSTSTSEFRDVTQKLRKTGLS